MTQTHIWWIRRDIRLEDNQALDAALQGAERLVPLFIIEPDLMANAAPARRSEADRHPSLFARSSKGA